MNVYNLTIGMSLFLLTHIFIWIQINGQFVWKWVEQHPILISAFGMPISWLLIIATKHIVDAFDGQIWPGRFIGFSLGMIVFAILTYYFLHEGINSKTSVSLVLSLALVLIQILWK